MQRGQPLAMAGRFSTRAADRGRASPMGRLRPGMKSLRSRQMASFVSLPNEVTSWSWLLFRHPCCFKHPKSASSHPPPDPHLLKPPPHVTRKFTSLVRRFLSVAESKPLLLNSAAAVESFRNEFLAVTRELFTMSQHSTSRHFVRWHRQTESATELAMCHPDQSLSVSELARQNGVPERTLRTAFQRCYGLSPNEFLRIQRLHEARRLLRASFPDEATVTQIAFRLGSWDLGRFAAAYRHLFGELPSETLKKPVCR